MAHAEPTGVHFKLRNVIRKGLRGAFCDEKSLSVTPLHSSIKTSPDAQEANLAVAISVLPLRPDAVDNDRQQIRHLHEHLLLAMDRSGLAQHSDKGKYAGVEATIRRGMPVIVIYASDADTLENILQAGVESMSKERIHEAFSNYDRKL